jgi:hypothetical protein
MAMVQPGESDRDRNRAATAPEWPVLVSRAVDDLSRILRAEINLLQLGIKDVVEREIDRALKAIIALVLIICGAICAIGAAILLLQVVLDSWWLAFAIVAASAIGAGVTLWFLIGRRPPVSIVSVASRSSLPSES